MIASLRRYDPLEQNIRAHNRLAQRYEKVHSEIFNTTEQARLKEALADAVTRIQTIGERPLVLDFGCGSGNLTRHLVSLGCDVVAADISEGFLDLIRSVQWETSVNTLPLNGRDLSALGDSSVDMVAAYSVLHHVPDYLGALREFIRVLRPGGVIYIDHEASERYWINPTLYENLRRRMTSSWAAFRKYLKPQNYLYSFIRRFINPRYSPEGDIHVYADDHIEWGRIRACLRDEDCIILIDRDYLLFRTGFRKERYEHFQQDFGDIQLMVAVKGGLPGSRD